MNGVHIEAFSNISNISDDSNVDWGNDMTFLHNYNNKQLLYHLPAIVYTAVMMLVGLPGNMIVFYVYFFKWRRSTSRMFILFLAALDMVNCATTLPMEIYIMRYSVMMDHPYLCKISRYAVYTMNSSSALILLGIAVDRFKRICRPYQKSFSENISKNICIFGIVFSLCSTWPSLIFYGTRTIDLNKAYGRSCLLQNAYDQSIYPIIFLVLMVSLTMLIFAALSVLYYFVGLQIYKHRNFKMKNCTHVQKFIEDKSVTVKSEGVKSSNERSRPSSKGNNSSKGNDLENKDTVDVGIVVTQEVQEVNNVLQPYHIDMPEPSQDPGTTCGMLSVPCNNAREISSDKSTMEFSTKNVTIESHITVDQTDMVTYNNEIETITVPKIVPSPKRRKSKVRRRSRKVRYLLVRGSSTLTASGRGNCANCLTVRIGKSTLMLFLITIAYILSFLPFYIIVIVRQSDKMFLSRMSKEGYMAYHVFLRSYLLSSAINPIIYSFCNAQFREYVCDFVLRAFKRRRDSLRP